MNQLPVTEENVKLCVNDEAQFKTSNLLEEDYLQNDRIGRIDKGNNKYHFVHIKNVDSNKNTIDIYDPDGGKNKTLQIVNNKDGKSVEAVDSDGKMYNFINFYKNKKPPSYFGFKKN